MSKSMRRWSSLPALALAMAFAPDGLGQRDGVDWPAGKELVPARPLELIQARPYTVESPMTFRVAGKDVKVSKGWVLVLKADLKLCEPLNAPDHVLYVGDAVAQRINSGYKDGHIVVVTPACDLAKAPIWFGARALPDRMAPGDFRRADRQRVEAGLLPFTQRQVRDAAARGGKTQEAHDLNELWYLQRNLIEAYAPAEKDMARSLRPGKAAVDARKKREAEKKEARKKETEKPAAGEKPPASNEKKGG